MQVHHLLARALGPRTPRTLGLLAFACLLAAVQLPAQAQWKWKDANGRVTVSDMPPPRGVSDKDILQRPDPKARAVAAAAPAAPAASAASAPAKPVDKELEARKRAAEAEKAAKARAEDEKLAAQRAENCKRARAHLAALDSGQRIARYNDKGEREILDDAGRATEARRAREAITSECR
jgi:Domain of unknown function (DUF4124)